MTDPLYPLCCGVCYSRSHRAEQCPHKDGTLDISPPADPMGACGICSDPRHRARQCPYRDDPASAPPAWAPTGNPLPSDEERLATIFAEVAALPVVPTPPRGTVCGICGGAVCFGHQGERRWRVVA